MSAGKTRIPLSEPSAPLLSVEQPTQGCLCEAPRGAELQADMAFEAYLAAFDEDVHPETLYGLETEALTARSGYDDLRSQGLGH